MKNLAIAFLFIFPSVMVSQTGVIRGRVTDAGTGDPLIGASIVVVGTQYGAASDLKGAYLVRRVRPGTYAVKCSFVGYQSITVNDVHVNAGKESVVDFQLPATNVTVATIEVTGESKVVNHAINQQMSSTVIVPLGSITLPSGEPNTEEYTPFTDNEYLSARSNPLSTFSIDVDVASYSNVRRYIEMGNAPPADAVRTEELLNYFGYDYPQPKGNDPFSITTEMSQCPWNEKHNLLLIGLQGKKVPTENLPPSHLVFLLDVSGSMEEPNKLPLVQASMRLLLTQLRPIDKVSIVVYAGSAGVILEPTSGDQKELIRRAIDGLRAGGSTAGGEGMMMAYKMAHDNFIPGGNNRIVWATDGDFNVGTSNTGDLVRLVEEKRKEGVSLSVLGFGMGNLKDSRLEQLADKGNGNYGYIDNFSEARRLLVGQMAGTLFTIAKDVKIQVEFNPACVQSYRLIGYENRLLSKEDFNNDKKDAGELGAGHCVTALYEVVPVGEAFSIPSADSLKYQTSTLSPAATGSSEMLTLKLRYKPPSDTTSRLLEQTVGNSPEAFASTSDNFRFASAVAEFAMLLRDSPFKGDATFDRVIQRAKSAKGEDPDGYRAEFVRLVETASQLVAPSK